MSENAAQVKRCAEKFGALQTTLERFISPSFRVDPFYNAPANPGGTCSISEDNNVMIKPFDQVGRLRVAVAAGMRGKQKWPADSE